MAFCKLVSSFTCLVLFSVSFSQAFPVNLHYDFPDLRIAVPSSIPEEYGDEMLFGDPSESVSEFADPFPSSTVNVSLSTGPSDETVRVAISQPTKNSTKEQVTRLVINLPEGGNSTVNVPLKAPATETTMDTTRKPETTTEDPNETTAIANVTEEPVSGSLVNSSSEITEEITTLEKKRLTANNQSTEVTEEISTEHEKPTSSNNSSTEVVPQSNLTISTEEPAPVGGTTDLPDIPDASPKPRPETTESHAAPAIPVGQSNETIDEIHPPTNLHSFVVASDSSKTQKITPEPSVSLKPVHLPEEAPAKFTNMQNIFVHHGEAEKEGKSQFEEPEKKPACFISCKEVLLPAAPFPPAQDRFVAPQLLPEAPLPVEIHFPYSRTERQLDEPGHLVNGGKLYYCSKVCRKMVM